MMKGVLLILFGLLLYIPVNAQTYFNVDFGNDSSANDNGAFVHEFADTSGYLVVGGTPMLGSQNYLRFLRLNVNGDTLWTKL